MRHAAVAALLLLAGCTWFSPGAKGDGCGDAGDASLERSSPGLAEGAAHDDVAEGNRTVRWDVAVADACQARPAHAFVEARLGAKAAGCSDVDLRASASTGLSELRIDLLGESVQQGVLAFDPRRPDLTPGPGSFTLSLAATMASAGSALDDHRCLDAAVQGFTLRATYARAA
jgi:hypothetical protein